MKSTWEHFLLHVFLTNHVSCLLQNTPKGLQKAAPFVYYGFKSVFQYCLPAQLSFVAGCGGGGRLLVAPKILKPGGFSPGVEAFRALGLPGCH